MSNTQSLQPEIIPLDSNLIHLANYNSFNGNRGNLSNESYQAYGKEILEWSIADGKKRKLLDELYKRYSKILKYEAQHISVMVAGPANYNSKKFDHGDDVLRSSAEFCEWFDSIRQQIKKSQSEEKNKVESLINDIEYRDQNEALTPVDPLMKLALIDNKKFIELFENLVEKYHWRKNSNLYKLYLYSKEGKIQEIHKEIIFEDDNFTVYKEKNRYYLKFVLRPKRQMHVALKSRGWWWNSYAEAYSTYLNRFDIEWVQSISERYAKYL